MLSYISCITFIWDFDVVNPILYLFVLDKNLIRQMFFYFFIFGKLEYTKPFEVKLIVYRYPVNFLNEGLIVFG